MRRNEEKYWGIYYKVEFKVWEWCIMRMFNDLEMILKLFLIRFGSKMVKVKSGVLDILGFGYVLIIIN